MTHIRRLEIRYGWWRTVATLHAVKSAGWRRVADQARDRAEWVECMRRAKWHAHAAKVARSKIVSN